MVPELRVRRDRDGQDRTGGSELAPDSPPGRISVLPERQAGQEGEGLWRVLVLGLQPGRRGEEQERQPDHCV